MRSWRASNFINLTIIMMLVNIVMNNTLTHYGAPSIYGEDIPLAASGVTVFILFQPFPRQGFFLIPLLLLLPLWFGLDGALYAGPASDSLACALSLTLVFQSFRQMPDRQ